MGVVWEDVRIRLMIVSSYTKREGVFPDEVIVEAYTDSILDFISRDSVSVNTGARSRQVRLTGRMG